MFSGIALATALLAPTPQQVNASVLVSRMLAKYSAAEPLVGRIEMQQSLGQHTVRYVTEVAYIRPERKLHVQQTFQGQPPKRYFIRSDGKTIAYTPPLSTALRKDETLFEPAAAHSLTSIFNIGSKSLKDPAPPLEIAIGHMEHLRFLRDQWQTVNVIGEGQKNGKAVYRIGGLWRPYGLAPEPEGEYSMQIDEDANLLSYAIEQNFKTEQGVMPLVTVYNAELNMGAKPNESLFKVAND